MYELVTIAFSHYCEKARWVLDRNRVPYRERRYLPGFHMVGTRRALRGSEAGAADSVSSRFSTPILLGAGAPITDSSEIMRHIEPSLYADAEAERLDRYFSEQLGPHSRRVAYWFCFENPRVLRALAQKNVSAPQALLFRGVLPLVESRMRKALKIDRGGYERSLAKCLRIADEVDEMLSDGRRYLVGDHFTAADLSFAAMIALAVMPGPESFGAVLPQPETLPEEARALVEEQRARPAGAFALRMFAEQRWPTA